MNNQRTPQQREQLKAFIREKHSLGWPDAEIARVFQPKTSREWISEVRRSMGLPCNALSEYRINKIREKTKEQIEKAGVKSLANIRTLAFREYARRNGWPEDLRPRAVQILNVLYQRGPMTRREIADAIGMPWKGSRKSLVSNDPEGSYLANLAKRGLVIVLHRARKIHGQGKGRSLNVYALPLHVERQIS